MVTNYLETKKSTGNNNKKYKVRKALVRNITGDTRVIFITFTINYKQKLHAYLYNEHNV